MLTSRDIAKIQAEYFAALDRTGSNLVVDKKQGSLAYTLGRASAAIAASQDNRMVELQSQSSLLSATGSRLDEMGSFIAQREQASRAQGFVLAVSKSDPVTIAVGSTLIDVSSGLQFATINNAVNAVSLFESLVAVQAVEFGGASNLPAGTQLYSVDYPDVCFRVGSTHTDDYYGDIIGGQDLESDVAYKRRLAAYMASSALSSADVLVRKLREYPLVDRAFVKTRAAGIVEVWVDAAINYTDAQRQELLSYIRPYLAAGTLPIIVQANRRSVNITLDVKPYGTTSDLSTLSNLLTNSINNLIFSLGVGESLTLAQLRTAIAGFAKEVQIIYPVEDIRCGSTEILTVGEIKLTFSATAFK